MPSGTVVSRGPASALAAQAAGSAAAPCEASHSAASASCSSRACGSDAARSAKWRAQEIGRDVAGGERRVAQHRGEQRAIGRDAEHERVVERLREPPRAASRVGACATSLASIESYHGATTCAARQRVVAAHARPARARRASRPPCGRSPCARVLGVQPHLDRVAAGLVASSLRPASAAAARRRRRAAAIRRGRGRCSASVTGCSTCRRVFISRK